LQKEAKAVADHDTVVCDGQDPENHLIDWSSMSELIQEVIFSLGLYLLIQQAITGADNVKPVDVSALYALAIQLQKRLSTLGDGIRRTLRYWVVGCRIFDLIGERSTTADIPGAAELLSCQGNVKFQNVEFAYGTKPVLRSVSFDCRPGETTVFVGKSGAGKSTILDLVFRNYFAQNGSVLIDGQDIRNLKRKSLRRHIGVVPQNPILLNRTIIENLRFANEGITDEQIKDKARSLGFHDTFQDLGYETNVGYSGSRLSGGQRMMVAITRIMVKGSKIILLDEATGPFDHLTEKIFHQAIDTMKSTKTVIMIA
jgi:ABC-type multidrug transport system fused ATPase/permease subunit